VDFGRFVCIFCERHYTSAGTGCGPVSVCLSITSQSSVETDERIRLIFGVVASFVLSYTSKCKENWVPPKITVFPSGTSPQTLDLENFATIGHQLSKVVVNLLE